MVLRRTYNTRRLLVIYPVLVGTTLLINSFFIIYKGAKGLGLDKIEAVEAIGYSCAIAGGGALLTIPLVPKIKKMADKKFDRVDMTGITMQNLDNIRTSRTELNINSERQLQTVISLHQNAEQFNPKIEETFKYLQIFSAICDSFSHGANDVANAIGPFAAIYTIYKSDGDLSKNISMGRRCLFNTRIGWSWYRPRIGSLWQKNYSCYRQ